jgi:hypothetical protein
VVAGSNLAGGMGVCVLYVLCVVEVEASARDRSLVQRIPTECVCVCMPTYVIRYNNNPLDRQRVGRSGTTIRKDYNGSCTYRIYNSISI